MKKFLFVVLLVVVAFTTAAVTSAQAQSAQTLLERKVFYQFNANRADPKAVDGRLVEKRLNGMIIWVGQPKPGKPTIMYLPGSGGNLASRRWKLPWFLDQGWGVVAMSYPGMGGSKGLPSKKKIQGLANLLYQKLPTYVGNGPVIIWGESLGTGVALEVANSKAGRKRPPSAIILQSPYTSLVDLVAYKMPKMMPIFRHRTDLWPSKKTIRRLKTPLLIMHGDQDKTIPVQMGRKLYELSPSSNKLLLTYPDSTHKTIWRAESLAKMYEWVKNLYR